MKVVALDVIPFHAPTKHFGMLAVELFCNSTEIRAMTKEEGENNVQSLVSMGTNPPVNSLAAFIGGLVLDEIVKNAVCASKTSARVVLGICPPNFPSRTNLFGFRERRVTLEGVAVRFSFCGSIDAQGSVMAKTSLRVAAALLVVLHTYSEVVLC